MGGIPINDFMLLVGIAFFIAVNLSGWRIKEDLIVFARVSLIGAGKGEYNEMLALTKMLPTIVKPIEFIIFTLLGVNFLFGLGSILDKSLLRSVNGVIVLLEEQILKNNLEPLTPKQVLDFKVYSIIRIKYPDVDLGNVSNEKVQELVTEADKIIKKYEVGS